MSCRDTKIHELILDYVEGKTDPQSTERVSCHLADCADCRQIEKEYRKSISGIRAIFQQAAAEHIPNDVLVRYVDNPEEISEGEISDIELHVAICPICENKVQMLRRVADEQFSQRSEPVPGLIKSSIQNLLQNFGRRPAVAFASAAVVILVFAAIFWSAIRTGDSSQIQFTSAENITWLSELTRSDQKWPEIIEENGRIRVGMRFHAFFDQENYTIQLQTMNGKILREKPIRKDDYGSIGVGMEIETTPLEAGEYRLMLITRNLSDPEYSLQVACPFILIKE